MKIIYLALSLVAIATVSAKKKTGGGSVPNPKA
jgi:hypothetical protein